jgi:hypothetical protein
MDSSPITSGEKYRNSGNIYQASVPELKSNVPVKIGRIDVGVRQVQ